MVPRIWGGVTSPKELKDIADIAVKYDVPLIKFTGGQRLDMFGVTKEQLAPMWSDLNDCGLVSGKILDATVSYQIKNNDGIKGNFENSDSAKVN